MGRIAGDDPGYTFRICRRTKAFGKVTPTKYGFELPSVSTVIGEVLAKPPSAMAWWGYKTATEAVAAAGADAHGLDPDSLYELLKVVGPTPNTSLAESGDRGTNAHDVLEKATMALELERLEKPDKAAPYREQAEELAAKEQDELGAEYSLAALDFVDTYLAPNVAAGRIDQLVTEQPVFSLRHRYAGTLDLAIHWADSEVSDEFPAGWEICDAKTHKPANGFTKPGKGPGYISDATQCRAYRTAWEEQGLGQTIGNRTIVLRDKAYKKVRWLADDREVSEEFWLAVLSIYGPRMAFEAGE
jgi:hypothetical protein